MNRESKFIITRSTLTDGSAVYAVTGHDMYGTTRISIDCIDKQSATTLADMLNEQFGIEVQYIGRNVTGLPA